MFFKLYLLNAYFSDQLDQQIQTDKLIIQHRCYYMSFLLSFFPQQGRGRVSVGAMDSIAPSVSEESSI